MVKLTKIYTKGGDKGKTSLGSGQRVPKYDVRIEAIGAVDEANTTIGLVQATREDWQAMLGRIKNDLFDLGADLCFPEDQKPEQALVVTAAYTERLERWIDRLNADLQPLTSFILPGGSRASATLHQARAIVRRAERRCAELASSTEVNTHVLTYLNRLSDFLFVLGRCENDFGRKDILWQPGGDDHNHRQAS